VPYSEEERLKWEVLAHTPHRVGLGAAWHEAAKVASGYEEQGKLVSQVVRELVDEGLIFCAYAGRDEGYQLAFDEFQPVDREALELELLRPLDYIEPEDHLFWLLPTEAGERKLCSLSRDAFLDPPPDYVIEARGKWAAEQGWTATSRD